MNLAVTIQAMVSAGCSPEQMLAVVQAHEAIEQKRLADKRAKDAERQRKSRMSRGVTVTACDSTDAPPSLLPSPTPPTNNSSPRSSLRSVNIRAREVFEKFWAIYPKRVNRKAALAKLETVLKAGVDPEKILAGTVRYAEHVKFTEPQFIKAPDAWLNAGKWDDELPAEPQKPQARAGPKSSSGNGFSVLLDELRAKRNGQQSSTNEPRDITPAGVPEPGAGDPSSRVSEPTRKPSGGGEILDFRSVSPDSRRSAAPFGEAARTFDWDDPVWRTFEGGRTD